MSARTMARVLIVEDQPAVSQALRILLELHGVPCLVAASPDEALAAVRNQEIGAVVQDMNFSRGDTSGSEGVGLFRGIRRLDPDLPVLILTAFASLEAAVQLMREGAGDYLAKPWDDDKLVASVKNLLRLRALQMENVRLRRERSLARELLAERYDLRGTVYASQELHAVVSLATQVARADVPVLITGPSGAGKEKIAEIIQANSARAARPFVIVNAGALPEELLESELFGAEAGAYTGAGRRRMGRFEASDGGTLFLDEIANLSAAGQMKLLRVLASGQFERLGSTQTLSVNVRVICATNANLADAIAQGKFREDLYYRLNVIELRVPPLAERPDDILPLAEHFLATVGGPGDRPARQLAAEAAAALMSYSWPGNVRELRNRVQRALLVARGGEIAAADLDLPATADTESRPSEAGPAQQAERARIERTLLEAAGNISRAAAHLGLSRQALYRKMERLGIEMERRPRD